MKIYNAIDAEYKISPLTFRRKIARWISALGFRCLKKLEDENHFILLSGSITISTLWLFRSSFVFEFKALPLMFNLALSGVFYALFITMPILKFIIYLLKKAYNF